MRALLKLGAVFFTTAVLVGAGIGSKRAVAETDTLIERQGALLSGDAVLDDGSLYDQHTFSGSDGQYVTIFLESEDFDPYLILLDPDGQRISENDDVSRVNRNSRLILTLPATGLYTAVANSFESGKVGEYAIKIDVATNRLGVSESLAAAAVPDSTAACSDEIVAVTLNLESDRDVNAWVSSLPLERVYRQVPRLRPHGVNIALRGPAALTVMSSPQLLMQLSASLVDTCSSVGAVMFDADAPGAESTFGFLPEFGDSRAQSAQGEAAAEMVESFDCAREEEGLEEGALLAWGEQSCS